MPNKKSTRKPRKGNGGKQQQKPKAAPNPAIAPPAPVEAAQATVHDNRGSEDGGQRAPDCKRGSRLELLFAAVVAAAATVQVVIASMQWSVMSAQDAAMVDQNKIMIDQMAQTERTLDQMQLERRAWLNVESVTMETMEVDKVVCAKIVIKNTGASAAKITSWGCMPWVVESPEKFFETMKNYHQGTGNDAPHMSLAIGPSNDTEFRARTSRPVTKEWLANLDSGKRFLFFVGEVSYTDTSNTLRHTKWCFGYATDTQRMIASQYGNDMD